MAPYSLLLSRPARGRANRKVRFTMITLSVIFGTIFVAWSALDFMADRP